MNTFAASMLAGMEHAAGNISLADDGQPDLDISFASEPLPFEEAIDFFKGKVSLTKEEWEALEPKLRFRAFTAARLAEADHIEMLRRKLLQAMEKKEHFAETWKDVKAFTEDAGQPFSAGYFETVYRTNMQSAYNAGRLMQYKNNEPPAWELLFIEDKRTSDVCRGLASLVGNGRALAASHSFWSTYGFPPYHFNCRTTFRAVYDYEKEHGTEIEDIPVNRIGKNFKPQKGFGGNPIEKESWWKITPAMLARADKYGVTADIVAQARELDMQSYFPELLQDYDVIYKGKKGGYVQTAKNADHDDNEIASAKRLADLGHKVYLLPRTYKAKSPDMIIDNEIGEMKRLGFDIKKSTTIETMKTEIKKAGQKQRARILYLEVADTINESEVFDAIKSEIGRTPIQKILLERRGMITEYSRSFFKSKK